MVVLKGKGFILRPFKKGDERSLLTNTLRKNYTMKDARKSVEGFIDEGRGKKKTLIVFAIDVSGEIGGMVKLYLNSDKDLAHKAELGYWTAKKYWGKGIMTDAIGLVSKYAFNELKLKRLEAKLDLTNIASKRVLEKNGFKHEGTMKKEHFVKGKYSDTLIFAKVKR